MTEEMYQRLAQAVIDGEPEDAEALAREALGQNLDPLACITYGLTPGIQQVGKLFSSGEYYLPELIIGADSRAGHDWRSEKRGRWNDRARYGRR
jgi:methanogenic corrinoid protein MtbC1